MSYGRAAKRSVAILTFELEFAVLAVFLEALNTILDTLLAILNLKSNEVKNGTEKRE